MRVRIVSSDGGPLGNRAWIRLLLRTALALPVWWYPKFIWASYVAEIISVALLVYAKQHRTLDDRIARTLVVDVRQAAATLKQSL